MCKKLKYKNIKIGSKVKWNEPGIEDYDIKYRKKVLDRIFKVFSINNGKSEKCENGDDIVGISDGFSEAEVYARELIIC